MLYITPEKFAKSDSIMRLLHEMYGIANFACTVLKRVASASVLGEVVSSVCFSLKAMTFDGVISFLFPSPVVPLIFSFSDGCGIRYASGQIARFVIDEAVLLAHFLNLVYLIVASLLQHCVSNWGHDFRPGFFFPLSLRRSEVANFPLRLLGAIKVETDLPENSYPRPDCHRCLLLLFST